MCLNKKAKFIFIVILLFSLFAFFACSGKNSSKNADGLSYTDKDASEEEYEIINLDGKFSWAYGVSDELETDEEFLALKDSEDFIPFDNRGRKNLSNIVGSSGNYIWLKVDFEIPESLKNHSLGLVIPYLHFAETLYINDRFVWSYGSFPPNYQSALYESHYYFFPLDYLNQEGKNTILIKVYCLGKATLSNNIVLTEYETAEKISEKRSFITSKIYIFFEGGLFTAMLLFFLLFVQDRKNKAYHNFAIMNLFTMLLLSAFFSTELPWFMSYKIPYLLFTKLVFCMPPVFIMYLLTSFIKYYIEYKEPTWLFIVRLIILIVPICLIAFSPTYQFLMQISPFVVASMVLQGFFSFIFLGLVFFKEKRKTPCIIIFIIFAPSLIACILDLIIRLGLQNILFPYFTIFGWQITIIGFLIVLTIHFVRMSKKVEYLNKNLMGEVESQTNALSEVNKTLESELHRSQQDLQMAAIVQNKYFSPPNAMFKGWQLSVCYKPLSVISGDLYDYYEDNDNNLEGFALFDVSGHALASGLVTMLAKNIIASNFQRAKRTYEKVSETLSAINDVICDEKGDIENYLTGILVRFSKISLQNDCLVSLSSASHPHPLLYHASSGIIERIGANVEEKEQYGAIGMKDMPIMFSQIDFSMQKDDILLLYTDGLTESVNEKFEQFSLERVSSLLAKNHDKPAFEIQQEIFSALKEFTSKVDLQDDITIAVLKRDDISDFIEELEEV